MYRIQIHKVLICAIVLCATAVSQLLAASEPLAGFRILPQPSNIALLPGVTAMQPASMQAVFLDADASLDALPEEIDRLRRTTGADNAQIIMQLSDGDALPTHAQGYQLVINEAGAKIAARTAAGLFYGAQTLAQMLQDAADFGLKLPAVRITDAPSNDYRAVHFDVKHHLDRMSYYYDLVDRLARHKINAIIFEFEDKLRYRRQPIVGAAHAMSIEEVTALSEYARARFIEISPLVQGLGHASFILKHEAYKHLRDNPDSDWAFCALNDSTYQVQFDLYRDAMDATPGSRYLHIGGDEVGNLGQSKLAKASGLSSFELQLHWLNKVSQFAADHDRIPIFWDDMPLKNAGLYHTTTSRDMPAQTADSLWQARKGVLEAVVAKFPKNCIYHRWNYRTPLNRGNQLALAWYVEHGLTAMAATSAQTTTPLLPRKNRLTAIRDYDRLAAKNGLAGTLCTAWDDASPHMESYLRGFLVHAEYAWSPQQRSLEATKAAFRQRMYGVDGGNAELAFNDDLGDLLYDWETMLIAKGRRKVKWPQGKEQMIKLPQRSGKDAKWLNDNAARLKRAAELVRGSEAISKIVSALQEEQARRNRFSLELHDAANSFMAMSSRWLVVLEEHADGNDQSRTLKALLKEYKQARESLLDTYAKTRFRANPSGYVLDQNHHTHQAALTNDHSWIMRYEDAFANKLKSWLTSE